MKDNNADYWKELLGDAYDEEIMKLLSEAQPEPDPGDTKSLSDLPPPPPQPRRPKEIGDAPTAKIPTDRPRAERPQKPAREQRPAREGKAPGAEGPEGPEGPGKGRPERPAKPGRDLPRQDKAPRKDGPAPEPRKPEDDFNLDFNFDEEYRDVPANSPIRPNRERRSGCLGGLLYATFIICVSLLIASLGWLAATDVLGFGNENEVVQVTIPKEYSISQVADILKDAGLIKYKSLFQLYARFSDADKKIVGGTYALNKNYDYRALVNGMTLRGGKRVEVEVTIPEGYTLKQIFQLLEANRVATEAELWAAAADYDFNYDFLDEATLGDKYRLEGFLFPDTYRFYMGDTPSRVINKMLSNFDSKFTEELKQRADELGFTVKEVVTIASLIEKEAGNDQERPTISSVIHNRLKSRDLKYLQVDATLYYAASRTGGEVSTSIESPYNTYLNPGLPPGPISNPGLSSIKAALYPEKTNYYYYALNKQGTHNFFKDYNSHAAFVQSDQYGG